MPAAARLEAAIDLACLLGRVGGTITRAYRRGVLGRVDWAFVRFLADPATDTPTVNFFRALNAAKNSPLIRSVEKLERRGLLERGPYVAADRSALFSLTDAGRELLLQDPLWALVAYLNDHYTMQMMRRLSRAFENLETPLNEAGYAVGGLCRPSPPARPETSVTSATMDISTHLALLIATTTGAVHAGPEGAARSQTEWQVLRFYADASRDDRDHRALKQYLNMTVASTNAAIHRLVAQGMLQWDSKRRLRTVVLAALGEEELKNDPRHDIKAIIDTHLDPELTTAACALLSAIQKDYDELLEAYI